MKIKSYKKDGDYSYSIGVFATLELLTHKSDEVMRVYIHTKGDKNVGIKKIIQLCSLNNIPIEEENKLIEKLSRSENTYAIGVFKKYGSSVNPQENHVVLDKVSDMGNLGAIIRTMVGFEVNNLVIIRPSVDIFDPKVIRASQGALFQMNFLYVDSFSEYRKEFPAQTIYPFMLEGKKSLEEVTYITPFSLVFGNEGEGLDDSYKTVGNSINIPQSNAIDSLNLSMSVGIALYSQYTN